MDREEVSRTGRIRKKSSKLLSLEQESVNDHELAYELSGKAGLKAKIKQKKSAPSVDQTDGIRESLPSAKASKAIPKLRIKIGVPKTPSKKSAQRQMASFVEEATKSKKRKSSTFDSKSPKQKKAAAPRYEIYDEEVVPEEEEMYLDDDTDSFAYPNDLEIDYSDNSHLSATGESFEAEAYPPAAMSKLHNSGNSNSELNNTDSSKRQRKPPTKLKEDYVDFDRQTNKAAKFFETKKAESRAATAIAKHEALKSGKKVKKNRLPTAYTMWCNSYRAKLLAQFPNMDFAAMNKKLGEVWWSVPLKEKNLWKRKAKRMATHGVPQKSKDTMSVAGNKATKAPAPIPAHLASSTPIPVQAEVRGPAFSRVEKMPVYKITQTEPVDVAAHFELMSESLVTIGSALKQTANRPVQGTLSILLDALLCGMSSLMCLTQQVPALDNNIDPETHKQRMANIALYIPDLS